MKALILVALTVAAFIGSVKAYDEHQTNECISTLAVKDVVVTIDQIDGVLRTIPARQAHTEYCQRYLRFKIVVAANQ